MKVEEIRKTFEKYGPLYPVLVDKNGNIIDGFTRKKVDPNWPEIKLEWVDNEIDRLKIGIIANFHRREITAEEISKKLAKLKELTGWNVKQIAENLGVSKQWVYQYLPQKYKDQFYIRNVATDEELLVPQHGTSNYNEVINPDDYITNVWFATEKRPKGFGSELFHGNTPPIIAFNCILKYTKENDIILDPMAGSGTLIDVCNYLKRKIIAFDIKPIRKDIKKADAEKLPLKNNSVDFVFAHFPYWNMVKYSELKEDLSNLSFEDYIEKSERIIKEIHRVLKKGKFFALLIGDLRRNKKLIDLSAYFSFLGQKYFMLFDKIIWVGKKQRSRIGTNGALNKWRAKKFGFHLLTFDTLLIFKKA